MHHFMFGPDWDQGCPSCSSAADGIGRLRQLHVRNTTLVAVSRAPYAKLAAFRERMGWTFPWYSSYGSDFNYDFHATLDDRVEPVLLHFRTEAELAEAGTPWTGGPWTESMRGEEMPGISAFLRVGDEVFHTYSTFGRGIEEFHNGYHYLDLTALGRQEDVGGTAKDARYPSACRSAAPRCACPTSTTSEQRYSTPHVRARPCQSRRSRHHHSPINTASPSDVPKCGDLPSPTPATSVR